MKPFLVSYSTAGMCSMFGNYEYVLAKDEDDVRRIWYLNNKEQYITSIWFAEEHSYAINFRYSIYFKN